MRPCRVVNTGRSARGIGCRPITPQIALKDFRREEAMRACARRAFVKRANSSWAGRGRAAQIDSGKTGSEGLRTIEIVSLSAWEDCIRAAKRLWKTVSGLTAMTGDAAAQARVMEFSQSAWMGSESCKKITRSGFLWARA